MNEPTDEQIRHFILNAETGYLGWSVPEPKSEPEEEPDGDVHEV